MKLDSIARRVVVLVLLVELVSALCLTGFVFFYERGEHFHSLDLAIRGRADTLMGAVVDGNDENDNVVLEFEGVHFPRHDIYEVWDNGSRVLGRSPGFVAPEPLVRGTEERGEMKFNGTSYRMVVVRGMRVVDPQSTGVRHNIVVVYGSPTREAWEPVVHAVGAFAMASGVLLAGSGLLVTLLIRRSMSPLKQLAAEAASISSRQWRFSPSERARQTRELAPLAAALEDLVRRLERSFAQQRQFVSDSAHELKTAITVVKSSLQLLELRDRAPGEYRAGVLASLGDCQRMEELVHRMLLLARIEEGAPRGGVTASGNGPGTALRKGAFEAAASLKPVAELRGVAVECTGPAEIYARIAFEDWETVCVNLLLNAVQHSAPGAEVRLMLSEENSYAACRVVDAGDGIAADSLPRVFDRFYRGDASRARSTGGSGLGLSIVKGIVEHALGRLSIESVEGAGTTVTVELPLAAAGDARAAGDRPGVRDGAHA